MNSNKKSTKIKKTKFKNIPTDTKNTRHQSSKANKAVVDYDDFYSDLLDKYKSENEKLEKSKTRKSFKLIKNSSSSKLMNSKTNPNNFNNNPNKQYPFFY